MRKSLAVIVKEDGNIANAMLTSTRLARKNVDIKTTFTRTTMPQRLRGLRLQKNSRLRYKPNGTPRRAR